MIGTSGGLRERKKARTRALIAQTAMGLFVESGFDEVTVAEVAESAEVAITTVFNYFPTKEDLFYDRQDEVIEHLSRVVGNRSAGESYASACRRDMLALIGVRDWRAGLAPKMGDFYRLIDRSPALQARARLMVDRSITHLAVTIAHEENGQADDIVVVTAASMLVAVRNVLLDQARRDSLAGKSVKTIAVRLVAATNRAFDLLDGGLADLGHSSGASRRSEDG